MTIQLQFPAFASAVAAEQTVLQIPSQPEWIAPTVEFLKEKAITCGVCHEARANKLMLALHEALTNAIVHGNLELSSELKERSENAFAEALAQRSVDSRYTSRLVEVRIDLDGQGCRWSFTDQGKGFDVERTLSRLAQTEPEQILSSGRGLLLMRAFLDDLRFELGGRRAILTLQRTSVEEQRQSARWPIQRPIRIAPIRDDGSVDWEAAHEAVAQNLSAEGIGFLQARLASTDRILIGIDWQGQLLYLPAEVRHCQAREGAVFELGCRFQVPASMSGKEIAPSAEIESAIENLLKQ